MIKASELRIGNWLEYNLGKPDTPDWDANQIDGEDIALMEKKERYLNEHRPIPLTEEWLLRFGFIPSQFTKDGFLYTDNPVFTIEPFGQLFMIYHKAHFTGVTVEFLHQIQNFFALIGQELALTPKTNEV